MEKQAKVSFIKSKSGYKDTRIQGTRNKEQGTRNKIQDTRSKEQGARSKEQDWV